MSPSVLAVSPLLVLTPVYLWIHVTCFVTCFPLLVLAGWMYTTTLDGMDVTAYGPVQLKVIFCGLPGNLLFVNAHTRSPTVYLQVAPVCCVAFRCMV